MSANAVLLALSGGALTNADAFKQSLIRIGLFDYLWHIVGGSVVVTLVLTVLAFLVERDDSDLPPAEIPGSESATLRRDFLANLKERYEQRYTHKLDGRFEVSLVVRDLDDGNPKTLAHPHGMDTVTHLFTLFQNSKRRMLIVGSPGSGKTVLLLRIALKLVEDGRDHPNTALPVIFNLAAWSPSYDNFGAWLKHTLVHGYGLREDAAATMLEQRRVVFLLDGLDELAHGELPEVASKVRGSCLASLGKYLSHGAMQVILCCRREEFEQIRELTDIDAPVRGTVVVQDLTNEQIEMALTQAAASTDEMTRHNSIAAENLLRELETDSRDIFLATLRTPFYFTVALEVFDFTQPGRVLAADVLTLKASLTRAYIEKKMEEATHKRFTREQALAWLTWLAVFLESRQQVNFELSSLQPSVLKGRWRFRGVKALVTFGSLSLSLFVVMPIDPLMSVFLGTIFAVVSVSFGNAIVTQDSVQWTLEPLRHWRTWRHICSSGIVSSVFGALIGGIGIATMVGIEHVRSEFNVLEYRRVLSSRADGVAVLLLALFAIGGFARFASEVITHNLHTENVGSWTLTSLRRWRTWIRICLGSVGGGVLGVVLGGALWWFAVDLVAMSRLTDFILTLAVELIFGVLLGAVFGMIGGTLATLFDVCRRVSLFTKIEHPYQRLRASIVFVTVRPACLATITMCAVLFGGRFVFTGKIGGGVTLPPVLGLVPVIGGIMYGVVTAPMFAHMVLRLCLWWEDLVPLRYVAFLNYMTQLRLLEKEGGEWRFRHQILQDYFASGKKGAGVH